jgi:hypothetical protein
MDDLTYLLNPRRDPDHFLDFLHYMLKVAELPGPEVRALEEVLRRGGSVWRASARGLERRVDLTATAALEMATDSEDTASDELAKAWSAAYGREPNASIAWKHALTAVEAVLLPIVVPGQDSPHIGHVLGQLVGQAKHWDILLRFNQTTPINGPPFTPLQALVGMLRLIYPNPDRHAGPERREPTIEEARAVVHLAVTIVQWGLDGVIVRGAADDA